jgi:hypothetical protein
MKSKSTITNFPPPRGKKAARRSPAPAKATPAKAAPAPKPAAAAAPAKINTESELLAAAGRVRRDVDQRRRAMTDEAIRKEPVEAAEFPRKTRLGPAAADFAADGIQALCGVRWWLADPKPDASGKPARKGVVFGLKLDAAMGQQLYDLIRVVVQTESDGFKKAMTRNTRESVWSHKVAQAGRINAALIELAKECDRTAKTASGTALAALKTGIVDAAYAKLGRPAPAAPKSRGAKKPMQQTLPLVPKDKAPTPLAGSDPWPVGMAVDYRRIEGKRTMRARPAKVIGRLDAATWRVEFAIGGTAVAKATELWLPKPAAPKPTLVKKGAAKPAAPAAKPEAPKPTAAAKPAAPAPAAKVEPLPKDRALVAVAPYTKH